ncbi:hypothetical protein CAPTEDRAFT_200215 [Capitella teleta]|uniref:Aminotransferase class I/classII large domain-containing protein n=1 Tax=Capitella teleta TaxID=283909 RepID=R7V378_CAPTE|nr:hypothetical protein CAPTEDRAFT_200215 [Capitella teleta]|eukprot:ELU10781.1 hypothetical protein CAPTEDRAFT_200215 [Capitella teleta]
MDPATFDRVDGVTLFEDIYGKQTTVGQYEDALERNVIVNLCPGTPTPADLREATRMIRDATVTLTKSDYSMDGNLLQYGAQLGSARFRTELSVFLSEQYGDTVLPKNVMVTNGASPSLLSVCKALFSPGSTVFAEDPTFFNALKIFKDVFQFNLIGVPTDKDGMQVDILEEQLEEHFGSKNFTGTSHRPFQCMIYTMPTFHNPTGTCLSHARCAKVIQLARKFEALVFCDDVYNMLHYNGQATAPPRLLTFDKPSDLDYKGHVISNGTFSKILGPGVRLGWVEAGDRLMHLFFDSVCMHPAGSNNHFMSEVVAEIMAAGWLRQHTQDLRLQYSDILQDIMMIFKQHLPREMTVRNLEGGYFFWLELPARCNATRVAELAKDKHNVLVIPGWRFSMSGSYQNCIRIAFTFNEKAVVIHGVTKLCDAIKEHLNELPAVEADVKNTV